jgi:hypothetical protein
MMNMMDALE